MKALLRLRDISACGALALCSGWGAQAAGEGVSASSAQEQVSQGCKDTRLSGLSPPPPPPRAVPAGPVLLTPLPNPSMTWFMSP